MTYCLGIMTREGLVMASDSRANAGFDQVNVTPKMHTFLQPGEPEQWKPVTYPIHYYSSAR
jgi:putative proteasome-type protease